MNGDQPAGRFERAIVGGSELLSKVAGASMGLLGPDAALLGPGVEWASHSVLRRIGTTVVDMVGEGAADRVGAAIVVVEADAEGRARRGETPRGDDFFEPREGHRPDSDELLEGVLMHAAASYEQRKVVLLGHLYDGIAFDPTTSADEGHYLLRLADSLTYRQLVALAVLDNPDSVDSLTMASYEREVGTLRPSEVAALQLDDLADQGVIGVLVEGADHIARPGELYGSSGRASAKPFQDLRLTPLGHKLRGLMRLSTIPEADQGSFRAELAQPVHRQVEPPE